MSELMVLVFCVAGAAAGAWIAYFRWKDKHYPEPLHLLVATTVAGIVSVGMALAGFAVLDQFGRGASWEQLSGPLPGAILGALKIGGIEEGAKLVVLLPIAFATTHFDEIWDGPVYAAAAGVGFAVAETLALFATGDFALIEGLARAVSSPITHALFAAPLGLGLAHAALLKRTWALPLGLAVSILVHGAYDLSLARPGFHVVGAGIVGAVWLWLLFIARDLVRLGPVER